LQKTELLEQAETFFKQVFPQCAECIKKGIKNLKIFFTAINDYFLEQKPEQEYSPTGQIIAWGALGQRGKTILPMLKGTVLEPTVLWDAQGDGINVTKPDPDSLTPEDMVLILPVPPITDEICSALVKTGCAVVNTEELMRYAASVHFSGFYNGTILFTPEGGCNSCSRKSVL
jgi:hypothetical protein